jgi:hypothetical protein
VATSEPTKKGRCTMSNLKSDPTLNHLFGGGKIKTKDRDYSKPVRVTRNQRASIRLQKKVTK